MRLMMLMMVMVIDVKKITFFIKGMFSYVFLTFFILPTFFRLDALALSVIATATWLAGWLGGCHTPVLYQNG